MTTSAERSFEDLRDTLGGYARIARQRWRVAFVALTLAGSLAFWQSQYLPRRYSASTIFERRDDPVLRNLVQANSPYSFDHLKATLALDITGSRAMAGAAAALGLLPNVEVPPSGALSNDALRALDDVLRARKLSASVRAIQSSPGLDTIRLTCEASDPDLAQSFAMTLRDQYIAQTQQRMAEILVGTRQFFQAELQRFEQQVTQATGALYDEFRDFPGIDPTDPASAGARLEALRQEQARQTEEQASLNAQIAAREKFLACTLTEGDDDAVAGTPAPPLLPGSEDVMAKALAQVEQELAEAVTVRRMTEAHPAVQALLRKREALSAARDAVRAQAAAAAEEARNTGATPPRPRYSAERLRVELELDALRRQADVLREACATTAERATRLSALYESLLRRGNELRELRDRLDQDTTTIATWRQNLGQLNRILSAASEQRGTQFTLLEEPKDAERPTSPRLVPVFAVCSGAGLGIAALAVALAEVLDRSFRSAAQVTRVLGVPVLESVGEILTPRARRRRQLARCAWIPVLGLLLATLFVSGTLAYTSLEAPPVYRRLISGWSAPRPANASVTNRLEPSTR